MHSSGINGEELRGQPANPGSPGRMAVCVYVQCSISYKLVYYNSILKLFKNMLYIITYPFTIETPHYNALLSQMF